MALVSQTRKEPLGVVSCPFCGIPLPIRPDKRGGRYFRCGTCLIAFFCSGPEAIERLDAGGTFTLIVRPASSSIQPRRIDR